jgi:hypothetical protein
MGGHPSLPLAVQCIPDRVLLRILDYSHDVYVGVLETANIKLRPSSRHRTNALCVNWWRLVRAPRGAAAASLALHVQLERDPSPPQRCALTRVRVWDELSMSHSAVTLAGNCGLLSNSFFRAALNMHSSREPGKTVWIWNQQHVVIWSDGQRVPEIRNGVALTRYKHIAAVNRKYVLATREVPITPHGRDVPIPYIYAQVFDLASLRVVAPGLDDPVAAGGHLPPLEVSIMAASFVDAESSEFLVVAHDFAVYRHGKGARPWRPETVLGNLMAGQEEEHSGSFQVKTYAWNCTLLYEAAGYVFSFCATLPDGSFFFHMCRFAADEPSGLTITTSWKSHSTLSCTSFDLQAAARTDCTIDIAPSDSSLLIYQSYDVLAVFDRKTLCRLNKGLRLPLVTSSDADAGYSRIMYKSLPSAALSVVVDGIRLSKEKRLQR